jgi:hypothetical protein
MAIAPQQSRQHCRQDEIQHSILEWTDKIARSGAPKNALAVAISTAQSQLLNGRELGYSDNGDEAGVSD